MHWPDKNHTTLLRHVDCWSLVSCAWYSQLSTNYSSCFTHCRLGYSLTNQVPQTRRFKTCMKSTKLMLTVIITVQEMSWGRIVSTVSHLEKCFKSKQWSLYLSQLVSGSVLTTWHSGCLDCQDLPTFKSCHRTSFMDRVLVYL